MNDADRPADEPLTPLEAFLAGDLEAGSEEERALLAADPGAAAEIDRHRQLRRRLRALPREEEPAHDLWAGVAARLSTPAPVRRLRPWQRTVAVPAWAGLAALLAVALGTGWLLRRPPVPPGAQRAVTAEVVARPESASAAASPAPTAAPLVRSASRLAGEPAAPPASLQPPSAAERARPGAPEPSRHRELAQAAGAPPRTPASRPARAPVPRTAASPSLVEVVPALAAYAETDRHLAVLRSELRRAIEARQHRLPPETRALVFANLETIERALAEIETALAGDPGDGDLARTYIEYRQREIAVLRRANALAARL